MLKTEHILADQNKLYFLEYKLILIEKNILGNTNFLELQIFKIIRVS